MLAKEEYCLFNNQKYNKNIDAKRYFEECIEHRIYHAQEEKIKDDIVSFSIEEDYVTLLQNYKRVHRIRMLKDKVKRVVMS